VRGNHAMAILHDQCAGRGEFYRRSPRPLNVAKPEAERMTSTRLHLLVAVLCWLGVFALVAAIIAEAFQ
jgi:hypothetical protein